MNYATLVERFRAEFARRTGSATGNGVFAIHRADSGWRVVSGDPGRPDAALAATRAQLAVLVPELGEIPIDPIDFGHGRPVGWLWEAIGPALIQVRDQIPDYQADGAVTTALAWVW